jgi:hypothetical protein
MNSWKNPGLDELWKNPGFNELLELEVENVEGSLTAAKNDSLKMIKKNKTHNPSLFFISLSQLN